MFMHLGFIKHKEWNKKNMNNMIDGKANVEYPTEIYL